MPHGAPAKASRVGFVFSGNLGIYTCPGYLSGIRKMDSLIKELTNNQLTQSFVVMIVGLFMKKAAFWIQTNKPPDERGAALLHVVIVLLSLVMGFFQQWEAGKLNAFDPKPWQDFLTVLFSTWGALFAVDKTPVVATKLRNKFFPK